VASEISGMQSILFRDISTSKILRLQSPSEPSRQSNTLAHYVVHELPKDIRSWSDNLTSFKDLAERHAALLASERARLYSLKNDQQAAVAQLDLLMLLGAYLPAKEAVYQLAPPLLLELLAYISAQHELPPRLTYELIVDVNTTAFLRSDGDIRTFSHGKTGRVERDFYIGHYLAEKHIHSSYQLLRAVLQDPFLANRHAYLQSALSGLEQFTAYMSAYSRLPADDYAYFRRFLTPYPDKIKNASGAFMPTPQLFETLLHTSGFAQTEYLRRNLQYFPRWAHADLQAQMNPQTVTPTVQSLLASGALQHLDEAEHQLLDALVEQFIRFKLTHIKVASSKIPEAFPKPPITEREDLRTFHTQLDAKRDGTGTQQGTGGFAPQDFLADGVQRLLDLQTQLRHG